MLVDAASFADSFSFPFLNRSSTAGVLDFDLSFDASLAFSLSFDVLVASFELVDGLVEVEADVEAEATSTDDALRFRSGLLLEGVAFELDALVLAVVEDLPAFPDCQAKERVRRAQQGARKQTGRTFLTFFLL